MKAVKMFYLTQCPYCRQAARALAELAAEDSAYGTVAIEKIEESQEPEIANQYDYYNVPTMYVEEEKIYEAHPGESYAECKTQVKKGLDLALGRQE